MFDSQATSWLTHARLTDVDAYDRARAAGIPIVKSPPRSHSYEMGTAEQQLAAIYELLQNLIHVSARASGKPKIRRWPSPVTAAEIAESREARAAYDDLMADIVSVSPDEFAGLQAQAEQEAQYRRDHRQN